MVSKALLTRVGVALGPEWCTEEHHALLLPIDLACWCAIGVLGEEVGEETELVGSDSWCPLAVEIGGEDGLAEVDLPAALLDCCEEGCEASMHYR